MSPGSRKIKTRKGKGLLQKHFVLLIFHLDTELCSPLNVIFSEKTFFNEPLANSLHNTKVVPYLHNNDVTAITGMFYGRTPLASFAGMLTIVRVTGEQKDVGTVGGWGGGV